MIDRTCCSCGRLFVAAAGTRKCLDCKERALNRAVKPSQGQPLSHRERDVVRLVADARPNKEIAYALRLTEGTIKEYMNRIFRKVGSTNRTELAVWAIRHPEALAQQKAAQ